MKIATWNIYWLGDRTGTRVVRSPEDEQVIAQVIAWLAPDVLAVLATYLIHQGFMCRSH